MAILPNNTDPSKDYVTPYVNPPLTLDGLVYNKVYAHTGVIDSLASTNNTGYVDPKLNVINNNNDIISFETVKQKQWISNPDFGGANSVPTVLTYNLSTVTYYNQIILSILNVPCFVELLDNNGNALPGASTFSVAGGSDIYTTTDWLTLNYSPNATLTANGSIQVRITRNKSIQSVNSVSVPVNISYSIGVKNFNLKLQVIQLSDVPGPVLNGTAGISTQNRFGFAENYQFSNYAVANAFSNSSSFWKSGPQPVKDSIVYFYAQVGSGTVGSLTPQSINRVYLDPLYTGCKFNIYYSTNSGGNDPSTFVWTPIARDFSLRKGLYEIPNVSCNYIKFEFTKLVPEVYDLPVDSVSRTINVFPYDVEQYYSGIEQGIINADSVRYNYYGNSSIDPSNVQAANFSSSTVFGAASQLLSNANNWPNMSALNNSQYGNTTTLPINHQSFIFDPTISYKTIDQDGNYNYQSYTEFLQRRFVGSSVHEYTQLSINQTWHQAYFVGLRYVNFFYENTYDDLRATPLNLISKNGTNTGFLSQDINYVSLNVDDTATTPWFSTLDSFNAFNIGGLTTDWRSFLSDQETLMNGNLSVYQNNTTNAALKQTISGLGTAGIIQVNANVSGAKYGLQSSQSIQSTNLINYYDANFLPVSGKLSWVSGSGTNATVTGATVNGTFNGSPFTASGLSVSGGTYSVATYNFVIPGVFSASGTAPWTLELATASLGVVGFASYVPASGINYYFSTNVTSTGNTTVTFLTRFVNSTGAVIAGTTVTGSNATLTGTPTVPFTTLISGSNYNSSIPSNTIQLVVSGSNNTVPFYLTQLGAFNSPNTTWTSPSDHKNMRISAVARIQLPLTNQGSYRCSLLATDSTGAVTELAYKQYNPGSIPINTWVDIELESYTGASYSSFNAQITQTNLNVAEPFYVSMLSAFYHPIRYEYVTVQGATNWQPITTGVNDPTQYIATVSGVPASGIQVRMTGLDPNVYISGVSIIPKYLQNPIYANLNINYLSNSKTNEVSSRRDIASKPYFQLNKELHPSRFNINVIAPNATRFYID